MAKDYISNLQDLRDDKEEEKQLDEEEQKQESEIDPQSYERDEIKNAQAKEDLLKEIEEWNNNPQEYKWTPGCVVSVPSILKKRLSSFKM